MIPPFVLQRPRYLPESVGSVVARSQGRNSEGWSQRTLKYEKHVTLADQTTRCDGVLAVISRGDAPRPVGAFANCPSKTGVRQAAAQCKLRNSELQFTIHHRKLRTPCA
jgi:hypothetical protein